MSPGQDINLILDESGNYQHSPLLSVVIPFYCQESIIVRNLDSVARSMVTDWELILIDDASDDDSLEIAVHWASSSIVRFSKLCRVRVYSCKSEVFETRCDAFGFAVANSRYLLEIQIDMKISEIGFDLKLFQALSSSDDLFMISGRGAQTLLKQAEAYAKESKPYSGPFKWLRVALKIFYELSRGLHALDFLNGKVSSDHRSIESSENLSQYAGREEIVCPDDKSFSSTGEAGRLGSLIQYDIPSESLNAGKIWLSQTVMRGPLIIDRRLYESINGLDEDHFFLGFDDHDLSLRAYKFGGLRCGFVPVGFSSPLAEGTTRKPRSLRSILKREVLALRTYKRCRDSELYGLAIDSTQEIPRPEIREF